MTLDDAVKLLEQYESAPDPSMAEFFRTVHNQDVRGKDAFDSNDVWQASRILNQYAMEGGDVSSVPQSLQQYTTPQYAQHIESQRAASDPGKTFGDQLFSFIKSPAVLTALGGVAGVYGAGAGAAAGAGAEAGTTAGATGAGTAAGAEALGSGITAGTTTGGIGGGALGSGLTAGTTTGGVGGGALGSGIGAAEAAGTALAPGFFASETASPVLGGATQAASSGLPGQESTTGVPATGGSSSLAAPSLSEMALRGLPAAFGAYASDRQSSAYGDLAGQYQQMGEPYRQRLSDLYSDPSSFLNSPEVQLPIQQGTNILARSLSTQGNPAGSGNALQELQNYSTNALYSRLGQEKDRLAGFGGLTAYNQAAPGAAANAINAKKGVYDAIGAGAADIFNPAQSNSLYDLYRMYYQ